MACTRSEREFYDGEPWRGTITLHPADARIEVRLNTVEDRALVRSIDLGNLRAGWTATAFTQLGPAELFLVGPEREGAAVIGLRASFDPDTWDVESVETVFSTSDLRAPCSVDRLPDGGRLVLLDSETATLHLFELGSDSPRPLLADPMLASMRYVHTRRVGERGVAISATSVSEALINGPNIGPYVELVDFDGDGVFETRRP